MDGTKENATNLEKSLSDSAGENGNERKNADDTEHCELTAKAGIKCVDEDLTIVQDIAHERNQADHDVSDAENVFGATDDSVNDVGPSTNCESKVVSQSNITEECVENEKQADISEDGGHIEAQCKDDKQSEEVAAFEINATNQEKMQNKNEKVELRKLFIIYSFIYFGSNITLMIICSQ